LLAETCSDPPQYGQQDEQMIFAEERSAGRSVRIVEVPKAESSRFSLNDQEVEELARYALTIEQHYARPMDIEGGKDGVDGKLYILQARPETVQSRGVDALRRYRMKQQGKILVSGRAIGQRIGSGRVCMVANVSEISKVQAGDVLVTDMTDPDCEPVMKLASAIVTNRGGRTCHAAIIARELGIPAVVGCGNATEILQYIRVSCSDGDEGKVYLGLLDLKCLMCRWKGCPSRR
jgi:pyruvate,water dikinase